MFQTRLRQKTTPRRYQNLEFQTLKDTTSTPTTLLYKYYISSEWMVQVI